MSENRKLNPEVQLRIEYCRFTVEHKRRIVAEAEQCEYGDLGSLLKCEGLTYILIGNWRKAIEKEHWVRNVVQLQIRVVLNLLGYWRRSNHERTG